jgi:GABA(A) receptor-associated protein
MITRKLHNFEFKSKHPFDKRRVESAVIKIKYPDRIPVICEVSKQAAADGIVLDKSKYLVPNNLTMGQFIYVIRRRIKLDPEKALFIFINNTLPPTGSVISSLYKEHKDEDGFLYISVCLDSVFG